MNRRHARRRARRQAVVPRKRYNRLRLPRLGRASHLALVAVGVLGATVGFSAVLGSESPEIGAGALHDIATPTPAGTPAAPVAEADQARGAAPAARPTDAAPGENNSNLAPGSDQPSQESSANAPGKPGPTGPSGLPGPDNTGVPAGTKLRDSGSITVTEPGTVISGLNINGCVNIKASNVTIEKSKISCARENGAAIQVDNGLNGILLVDVEVDGRGITGSTICCGGYTIRRANLHNSLDGPRMGSYTVVEHSWIHHLSRVEGSHNDTIQTTGGSNITVRNNRLDVYNPTTNDLFNAAMMLGSESAPLRNVLFENNYCNGGNYTINIRSDTDAANVVFRNNTFGRDYRYGIVSGAGHPGVTWDRQSNVFADTKEPVL